MANSTGNIIFSIGYILISIMAIVANLLVIVVTLRSKALRSCTAMLVCNLCASDLILVVANLPYRASRYLQDSDDNDRIVLCRATVFIQVMTGVVANSSLFLVTLDRYVGVHYPLYYKTRVTRGKTKVAIIISILVSLLTTAGIFITQSLKRRHKGYELSLMLEEHGERHGIEVCIYSTLLDSGMVLFINIVIYIIPLLLTVIFYAKIMKTIYIAQRSMNHISSTSSYNHHHRSTKEACKAHHKGEITCKVKLKCLLKESKTAKPICIIVTIHLAVLLPIISMDVMNALSANMDVSDVVIKTALFIVHCCPVLNPLIYGILNPKYREAIKECMNCRAANICLLYTSPSPRDQRGSRMPSSA